MKKILLFIVLISLIYGCASQSSAPIESTAQPAAGNMKNRLKANAIKPSAVVSRPMSSEKYYKLYSQYVDGKYSTEEFIDICNKEIDTALLNDKTIAELYGYIALAAMKDLLNNGTRKMESVYVEATKKAYRYDDTSVLSIFLYAREQKDPCKQYNLYKYVLDNIDSSDLFVINKDKTLKDLLVDSIKKKNNESNRYCIGDRYVMLEERPDNIFNYFHYLDGSAVSGVVENFIGEMISGSFSIENGIVHGISKLYENGNLYVTAEYDHGILKKVTEYNITDGKAVNEIIYLSEHETIMKIYENGVLKAEDTYVDDNIVSGIKYYPSGAIQTESAIDGVNKFYYENGKLEAVFFMKNNVINGKYEKYYENGKVKRTGQYENDKEVGKFISYYRDGKLEAELSFKNGLIDGNTTIFYENGKIKTTGQYKDGKAMGKFLTYYESGMLRGEQIYKNDIIVSERRYRKNGKLWLDDIAYQDDKIVSGYCILSKTGKKVPLTTAEIINWNNGYEVACP